MVVNNKEEGSAN